MGLRILNIFGLLLSIVLYYFAPNHYSFHLCLLYLVFYVVFALINLIKRFDGNLFTFDVLFLLSFLLTNFIYPVFYYPSFFRYFSLFGISFPENVITNCNSVSFNTSTMFMCYYELFCRIIIF